MNDSAPHAGSSSLPRLLRYLLVGAGNTAVGYGLFALCVLLLSERMPHGAILVLAHLLSVSVSFASHRHFVFGAGTTRSLLQAWWRCQVAYLGLLGLGLAVNGVMLRAVTDSIWWAQAAATAVGVVAGWFLHRRFVFPDAT